MCKAALPHSTLNMLLLLKKTDDELPEPMLIRRQVKSRLQLGSYKVKCLKLNKSIQPHKKVGLIYTKVEKILSLHTHIHQEKENTKISSQNQQGSNQQKPITTNIEHKIGKHLHQIK